MDGADSRALEDILGHAFADPALLRQALTHASLSESDANNERLEFLGDRVLGLCVARMLFDRFPDESEGALAARHAALVRREGLARVAVEIGLGAFLRMTAGEAESGGRENPAILADACEAVIGALYVDGGLDAAERFVLGAWTGLMDEDPRPPKDPKTALQEWAQGRGMPLPRYREVGRQGPAHAPVFTIGVTVEGYQEAEGTGSSKRAAEQDAAERLLDHLAARRD